jgi:hypothetical protein
MARREPLGKTPVRVVVMAIEDPARAEQIGKGLVQLLGRRGRKATSVIVRPDIHGWNRALEHGLHGGEEPAVIVTSATAPWSDEHLDPLLQAIDARDHAIGRRPATLLGKLARGLGNLPYRFLFAVPVADVYSPVRIHRRAALARIPLQSASRLLDVEILAKATFFVQTIEEVDVPALPALPVGPTRGDLSSLFAHPVLRTEDSSRPPEPPQGQGERPHSPGPEDGQSHINPPVEQSHPLEHHSPEGVE